MRPVLRSIEASPVTGEPGKKHRSPSDRARDARRVQKRIEQRLLERTEAWENGGRDRFLVERQDGAPTPGTGPDAYLHHETVGSLAGLHVERRDALAKGRSI